MEFTLTLFLAKFLGLFCLILGLSMFFRRELTVQAFEEVFKNRALPYILGIAEVLGGLLIVLNHNIWAGTVESVISALGWLMLIEGVSYLLVSNRFLRKIAGALKGREVYYLIAVSYLAIGVYLVYMGFFR